MRSAAWHPSFLIRLSIALHLSALMLVVVEPGQWRWALGGVIVNQLVLTLAVGVAAALLAGLLPAWRATLVSPAAQLKIN